jgi:predicted nucleic acid-binding protein
MPVQFAMQLIYKIASKYKEIPYFSAKSALHAHPIDKQIAAIALIYDLTVVTHNVDDFRSTGAAYKKSFV